ncbi:hypothetical protein KC19_4G129800 [Ceratodon purpureus]|uniref:Leucine-rich repeat-containing N-terminal plant-type domain-containing protein n=1 Tax=Ceratodon purpureus TaxID=3225 RepID=A0A8T0IAB2_CERPU|nr:hypothetical protein KC19_4G129800 [Ceratodon purpureus]
MTINGVTSSLSALYLLFLSLSLLTRVALSAPAQDDHLFKNQHIMWKSLRATDRLSRSRRLESWERNTGGASNRRPTKKYGTMDSYGGMKLSMSRSLIASNATLTSATEGNALIAFRNSMQTDPTGALANWTVENIPSYCSIWRGVSCNPTGNVIGIDLPELELNGTITPMIGDLVHLEFLNLSYNHFWGPIPSELTRCQNLSGLDLSTNSLNGELPELFSLPKLELLYLAYNNNLSGPLPEFKRCESLTDVWMDSTNISGAIPSSLRNCQNLVLLSLATTNLNGSIPVSLGELHKLVQLWLGYNKLTGHIPSELGLLKNLKVLDLGSNNLEGSIPPSLGNCSSLTALFLDTNNLEGSIPPSLANCSSLEVLYLRLNNLSGIIPEEFGNMTGLILLYLDSNHLSGTIPASLGNLTKLQWLDLTTNNLTGSIPQELGGCLSLKHISLADNNLTGGIPRFLGNFSSLVNLFLGYNSFIDNAVAISILSQCSKLETLGLQRNKLYGSLQFDFFTDFPSLKYFSVAGNMLTGGIPSSFSSGVPSSLIIVDFRRNKFTGELPGQVDSTYLPSLRFLYFSDNQLEGSIPPWIGNLKSLQVLDLSRNRLTGPIIPQDFHNLSGFKVQPESEDSSIGEAGVLYLYTFNPLASSLNVSFNYAIYKADTRMDLSSNALQGGIPQEIADLVGMKYLNLSNNNFDGEIWSGIQNLKALETLDLSRNNLSGRIPSTISSSVNRYNVSFNNLDGPIPSGGQFDTFTDISIYLPGNPRLCGAIIHRPCDKVPDTQIFHVSDFISIPGFGIGVAGGFCTVLVTILVWAPARLFVFRPAGKRKEPSAYGLFKFRFY